MCIRDRDEILHGLGRELSIEVTRAESNASTNEVYTLTYKAVSYTHLRAHETVLDLVCRLLLEKKKLIRMFDI